MKTINISSPVLGEEEYRAVKSVMDSGQLAQGKLVEEFEKNFAQYTGAKYAIAVNNGTAALYVALLACEVKGNVITTPFTFVATANSILYANSNPRFVDVLGDGNISPLEVSSNLKSANAVMPVHLYGKSAEIKELAEICKNNNLILIEDAAQAHGCKVDGKHVGTFGSAGCFSFYPTKNMTTGEGGIIITNDKEVAEKARLIRNHGQTARYEYKTLGFNFRLTELAAAIGIEQLKKLDKYNLTRRKNATQLNQELENLEWIDLPEIIDSHVFHLYTVRVKSSMRERFLNHLKSKDIIAGVYYPKALYEYDHLKRFKAKCPVTDVLTREVVSIPVHHGLNEHDINRIIEAIKSFKP